MHDQESTKYPIRTGVPQDNVLGPILWKIYINHLLNAIPETAAYADDIQHLSYNHSECQTVITLQQSLDFISY